jgi:hypothetical protein
MIVHLLPLGGDRFDLYSEAPEDAAGPAVPGRKSWSQRAHQQWRELVQMARRRTSTSRFGRWRDGLVRRLAESIAEQRTLWALGRQTDATLLFPPALTPDRAQAVRNRVLTAARRHHGLWLAVDLPLLIVSAILAPIPGPNAIAYYLAFRVVGHLLTWRGAQQALKRIRWTLQPEPRLDELAALVALPRAERAARIDAIAKSLNLPRLAAFVDRVVC